ncbi:MAG: D-aminoacyl-tRNA deacylase [Polyangiales bacterium]
MSPTTGFIAISIPHRFDRARRFDACYVSRMRAVVQRVHQAAVVVEGETVGAIDRGLLVYLGAARDDQAGDVRYTVDKIAGLRVFPADDGRMSRSVIDVAGAVLVVSQFTLFGDVRRGRRPSFDGAAPPQDAERLYLEVVDGLRAKGLPVETGTFRATMRVESHVDGPVTIQIDSGKLY